MSKNSITAKNVFVQVFVTLFIGIAIGFFIGYPIGQNSVDVGEVAPTESVAATADAELADMAAAKVEPPAPEEDIVTEDELAAPLWPGRHLFIAIRGSELDDETRALLEEIQPGGVVLLGDNIADRDQTIALTSAIKSAVGLGTDIADVPLIAVDQEGGMVNRLGLEDAPAFADLGARLDRGEAADLGKRYGSALSARGIGVLFAPVLDVRNADTPEAIAARTLGDDNAIVTPLGLAFADGAMEAGVISVVKHYPGHGAAAADSHEELAVINQNISDLAQTMFPFSEAVNFGIQGVMAGHIAVPALDEANPERPVSLSPRMLRQILRDRWEYEGVIIADDINMTAITANRSLQAAAVEALAAGNDAIIYLDPDGDSIRALCTAIEQAVSEGILDKASLIRSRKRLDGWSEWLRSPRGLRGPLPMIPEQIRVARASQEDVDAAAGEAPEEEAMAEGTLITHTIARGESLSSISRKYDVRVEDVMAWNDLADGNIKFGFDLKIYQGGKAPSAETPQPEPEPDPEPTPEPESDPEPDPEPEPEEPPAPPEPAPQPAGTKAIVHEVAPGEMLSRLAVRYRVSQSDIMSWTGITDPIIKIGQRLTIYVPEDFELPQEPAPTPEPVEETAETDPEPEAEPEAVEEETAPEEDAEEAAPEPEPESDDPEPVAEEPTEEVAPE